MVDYVNSHRIFELSFYVGRFDGRIFMDNKEFWFEAATVANFIDLLSCENTPIPDHSTLLAYSLYTLNTWFESG